MTIEAKLIRNTEVRTSDTQLDPETGARTTSLKTERTVRLSLAGAPTMHTGYSNTRAYRPTILILRFMDGKLVRFLTEGYAIKKDGTAGTRTVDDDFYPNGERYWYRQHGDAPAEIMDIVRRYAS